MQNTVESYESITHFLKVLKSRDVNSVFADEVLSSHKNETGRFYGNDCPSYDKAVEFLSNGYNVNLDKFKAATYDMQLAGEVQKVRPYNHVVGFLPNVPNALQGLPLSMIQLERQPQKIKSISILYSPSVSGDVDAKVVLQAGEALLKVINSYEMQGYGVELKLLARCSMCRDSKAFLVLDLKGYGERLDLKKLTFPLVHASMQRRIGFYWMETCPSITETAFADGYGRSITTFSNYEDKLAILKELNLLRKNTFYLDVYMIEEHNFDPKAVRQLFDKRKIEKTS